MDVDAAGMLLQHQADVKKAICVWSGLVPFPF
jgi:hypothetical protein